MVNVALMMALMISFTDSNNNAMVNVAPMHP
jgi:hypothetical protein